MTPKDDKYLSLTDEQIQDLAAQGDENAARVAEQRRAREQALAPFTQQLPADNQVLVNEIRFYAHRSVEDIFEAGRRLIALRERLPGQFIATIEEEIGLPRSVAYRFMRAAEKAQRFPSLAQIEQRSKVYALLEAPDEELAEFEAGGDLAGIPRDEINLLTVKELRERLRKGQKTQDKLKEKIKDQDRLVEACKDEIQGLREGLSSAVIEAEKQLDVELKAFQAHFNLLRSIDPDNVGNDVRGLVLGHYTRLTELVSEEYQDACERFHATGNPDLTEIPLRAEE